jgi:hypothetical protein
MSTNPRHYVYVWQDRAIGEVSEYLGLPPEQRWWALSSINEDDGGRGFPSRFEAERWLRVNAEMETGKHHYLVRMLVPSHWRDMRSFRELDDARAFAKSLGRQVAKKIVKVPGEEEVE